jgi:hypothetical protein
MEQAVLYPSNSSYSDGGSYMFDPGTILLDLDRGETDIFTPIPSKENMVNTPFPVGLHLWSQSDYLNLAGALHQFAWTESMKGWHIYSMYFFRNCQDNSAGFDSGEITYFKAIDGPFSYATRVIDIYPAENEVSWSGDAKFPRPLLGWQRINLAGLKVTADDALQIAEKNGGEKFRLKVKNICAVDVFLNPNPSSDDNWIVYYNDPGRFTFEIHIDPYSGEYKKY